MTKYSRFELWVDGVKRYEMEIQPQFSSISSQQEREHAALTRLKRYAETFKTMPWQIFQIKKSNFRPNLRSRYNKKFIKLT